MGLWNVADSTPVWTLTKASPRTTAIALAPDGQFLACGHDDGMIRLWESGTGRVLGELHGHNRFLPGTQHMALHFLPDGRLLSGSTDQTTRLWDVRERRQVGSQESERSSCSLARECEDAFQDCRERRCVTFTLPFRP